MNQNNYYIIFILSVLLQLSLCASSNNPYFNTCSSRKCGDVNVGFPFYISNQRESYCGYPGFDVSCQNGSTPNLNISGNNYLIRKIWYENQTFEVVNSVFLNTNKEDQCSDSIRNLTFLSGPFEFATNHSDMLLLIKCPDKYLSEYQQSMVNCGALAVGENDPGFGALKKNCDRVAAVPYEDDVIIKNGNFEEALQRGVVLSWMGTENCSDCAKSGGQCGFDQTLSTFQCYCSDRPHSHQCTPIAGRSRLTSIIISATGASALVIVLFIILVLYSQKRSVSKSKFLGIKGKLENQNVEAFLKSYGSLAPKRYTYTNIKRMTNSFKDKLGEGGYGHVYKGKLLDGRTVAVKVLKKVNGNGEEFLNEVVSISRTNHVNVVTLLGFCFEGKKRALVYEFMPNGSLEKFIHGARSGQPLPCETLFNISVGIARGLDYLHRGCNTRILHFDIKPHNILLDEKFNPKISDFGLARLFPKEQSHISSFEARGTIGYIAPEVFCRNFGGVSHKSDVYSFGMMIIDMVCGRNNVSAGNQCSSDLYFPQWIYNQLQVEETSGLQGIADDEENNLKRKMILVGLWCIQTYPSNRPSMYKVLEMLEGSLESLQVPPKPDLSSPPISASCSSGTSQSTR